MKNAQIVEREARNPPPDHYLLTYQVMQNANVLDPLTGQLRMDEESLRTLHRALDENEIQFPPRAKWVGFEDWEGAPTWENVFIFVPENAQRYLDHVVRRVAKWEQKLKS